MVNRPTDIEVALPPLEPTRLKTIPENVFVNIGVQDMTETYANAVRDVERYRSAVPARNRTYRVAIGSVTLAAICWMAFQKLTGDGLSKVLIAAIVSIGGVLAVREYRKKKE
jgi:hypothetical protein